ncbi:MAG: DNA translocase FtsK [bacterium]|nr:DNA translocase FtsK [bacterium]
MPRTRSGPLWRRAFRIKLKKHTLFSIAQVLFFATAGLIIVSFSRQGSLLLTFNQYLLRYFSWTALFLPFILITSGLMFSKFQTPLNQPNVLIGSLLVALCLAALSRAGLVGEEMWGGIAILITTPGAALIFFGGALIGVLILFNASLDQVISIVLSVFLRIKHHLVGGSMTPSSVLATKSGIIKVSGGEASPPSGKQTEQKEEIARPAVNIPGTDKVWDYPALSLLQDSATSKADRGDIKANAAIIEKTLDSFGVQAKVVEVNLGPAVTQYALEVSLGTKLTKITGLANDLALALAAPSGQIRIEAPIPGRAMVGIELPNMAPEFVPLRRILEADTMRESRSKLTLSLGLDVAGKPVVANLAKMPHCLIAGQTGSGKSVAINTFISTILFRASPNEVKFILVDPKRVELTGYNGIPHLLAPVITDPEKVISALKYLMGEMDHRYKMFAQVGARNIESYNEISGFQALPYIVLVIDELADIMMFSPVEVEDAITRLAQMSRATGIHMILATQRPSVDVLTGLLKANIPTRIAFAVSSLVDSRVILDTPGAERLLGRGDMLFLPPDEAKPRRIQGAYISDNDVNRLIEFLRKTGVSPQYTEEVTAQPVKGAGGLGSAGEDKDNLFADAVRVVCSSDKASASLLQRRLAIGYARAARILDQLEARGIVGPADGAKPREVLNNNVEEILGAP